MNGDAPRSFSQSIKVLTISGNMGIPRLPTVIATRFPVRSCFSILPSSSVSRIVFGSSIQVASKCCRIRTIRGMQTCSIPRDLNGDRGKGNKPHTHPPSPFPALGTVFTSQRVFFSRAIRIRGHTTTRTRQITKTAEIGRVKKGVRSYFPARMARRKLVSAMDPRMIPKAIGAEGIFSFRRK